MCNAPTHLWVDAKLLHQLQVGGHSHHVLGNRLLPQLSRQPRPARQGGGGCREQVQGAGAGFGRGWGSVKKADGWPGVQGRRHGDQRVQPACQRLVPAGVILDHANLPAHPSSRPPATLTARALSTPRPPHPPDCACVEHGLGGGEGLGDDDDQGGLRVQPVQGLGHIHGVDVGQEAQPPAGRQWEGVEGQGVGLGVRLGGRLGVRSGQVGQEAQPPAVCVNGEGRRLGVSLGRVGQAAQPPAAVDVIASVRVRAGGRRIHG